MKTFEDLKVFRAALVLRIDIHRATSSFPKDELFGMVSQLRRAAGSVMRHLGPGASDIRGVAQMLSQGRGSLFEVESELISAQALGYLDDTTYRKLRMQARDVGCLLMGLIRYVKRREIEARRGSSGNSQRATRY